MEDKRNLVRLTYLVSLNYAIEAVGFDESMKILEEMLTELNDKMEQAKRADQALKEAIKNG